MTAFSSDVPAAFSVAGIDKNRPWKITVVRQECRQSGSDEIVVCGRHAGPRDRLRASLPADNSTLMDDLGDELRLRLGPVEMGSLKNGDSRVIGLRIMF